MRQIKLQAINGWTLIEEDGANGMPKTDFGGTPMFFLDGVLLLIDAPTDGDIEEAIRDEFLGRFGEPRNDDDREIFEEDVRHHVECAKLFGDLLAVIDPDADDACYERATLRGWIESGITIDRDNVILTVEPDETADGKRVGRDNYGNRYELEKCDDDEWEDLSFDVSQPYCDYWDMSDFSRGDDFKKVIFK